MEYVSCFLLLIAIAFTVFWACQLYDLMRRKDDEFPGRYDKALWVVILLFVPVIGVILYFIWQPHPKDVAPPRLQREWEAMQRQRALREGPWSDDEIPPEIRPDISPEPPKA